MWDFRLGSDSYCLCVIFRADTGSLWHAMKHMDAAAFSAASQFMCPACAFMGGKYTETHSCSYMYSM